jgi:hypothetical protein
MTLKTLHRILICFTALAISRVSPCAAQRLSPVSFDFNVGVGFGDSSGPYDSNVGVAADALVGFRSGARARTAGRFVVAVSGSGQVFGGGESCTAIPGIPCTSGFPEFGVLSTLAGWETGAGGARLLVGPAVARSRSEFIGAAQARLDLAKSISSHFSLLVSGRFTYIPRSQGESFSLGAIGVGFRLR